MVSVWAPLEDLTNAEAHAVSLGLVGAILGIGWEAGLERGAAGLALTLVAIVFGLRRSSRPRAIAHKVVRREPWWFLASLTASFAVTVLLL